MTIPPTLLVEHYLGELTKTPELVPHLSSYNRAFSKHKREVGDHVVFPETIDSIYEYLLASKCPRTLSTSLFSIVPTANYGSRKRLTCKVCDGPHDADDCHKRGLPFMPPSMAKKILRFNEIHGSVPKTPKKDYIQAPFKPQHTNVKSKIDPTANMATVSVPIDNTAPISSPDTKIEHEETNPTPTTVPDNDTPQDNKNLKITPAVAMADRVSITTGDRT